MSKRTCSVNECNRFVAGRGLCDAHYRRLRSGKPIDDTPLHQPQTTEERFWAKVEKTDTCWLWTGKVLKSGYGVFYLKGKYIYPHRWSYEHHIGPIPKGLTIDHVASRGCTNKNCVNPAHLEAVTQRINTLRSSSPAAQQARQTHCKRGHEFTPENTRKNKGHRYCRTCQKTAKERG